MSRMTRSAHQTWGPMCRIAMCIFLLHLMKFIIAASLQTWHTYFAKNAVLPPLNTAPMRDAVCIAIGPGCCARNECTCPENEL